MSFVGLGLAVALLAYGVVNVLGTGLVAVSFLHAARIPHAAVRARRLVLLRLLPSLSSLVAVGVFVVPAYLWFEPRDTMERVRAPMVALAALGLLMLVAGPLRGLASVLATRRISRRWRRSATALSVPGIALPALVVDESFPLVSVVGWLRPRLVVARSVLLCCDRDEIAAILAHEAGHTERRDPWVRLMVRACPDFLSLTPWADRMERVWTEAAEQDADERAARTGPTRALDLASALVKVARLAGAGRPPAAAAMALYRGEGVSARVVRLLEREEGTQEAQ
ncbi:MAG TPA: M48 family metalloprotease, partial [Vicinamibacteria bacterium]|nr:M48 family metalloprotease [Vicinamibacteria bacterium]